MRKTLCLWALACNLFATCPEYTLIETPLPFDGSGFFSQDNADHLDAIMRIKNSQTIIEVGSWLGSSTRFMAERLPNNGLLYAVDTWEGSVEHHDIQEFQTKLPSLYEQFLSNVIHTQLQDKIEPIRTTSQQASSSLNVKADLIFIDAAHDTESVYQDILAWYPHLNSGGVICGDDWTWGSVRKGVEKAAEELHADLVTSDSFWYFKPSDGSLDFPKLTLLNCKGKWHYMREYFKGKR